MKGQLGASRLVGSNQDVLVRDLRCDSGIWGFVSPTHPTIKRYNGEWSPSEALTVRTLTSTSVMDTTLPLTTEVVSCLTCSELLAAVGDQVEVSYYIRSRKERLVNFVLSCDSADIHQRVLDAVSRKIGSKITRRQEKRRRVREYMRNRRAAEREERRLAEDMERRDIRRFLELPSDEQVKSCYRAFMSATSHAALEERTCAVCGRLRAVQADGVRSVPLSALPNSHRLKPTGGAVHPAQVLVHGLLLEPSACVEGANGEGTTLSVCRSCFSELSKVKEDPPMYSLANSLWIGPVPHELATLTLPERLLIARVFPRVFVVKLFPKDKRGGFDPDSLQNAMKGNVTSFDLNTDKVADMIEGRLMPQMPAVLSRVLSVTYVGPGRLPKNWLRTTFRVRRHCVRAALLWLKQNNSQYYGDIVVDEARLDSLPEDDVPEEVLVTLRQETDLSVIEEDTYVPTGEECPFMAFDGSEVELSGIGAEASAGQQSK